MVGCSLGALPLKDAGGLRLVICDSVELVLYLGIAELEIVEYRQGRMPVVVSKLGYSNLSELEEGDCHRYLVHEVVLVVVLAKLIVESSSSAAAVVVETAAAAGTVVAVAAAVVVVDVVEVPDLVDFVVVHHQKIP